MKNSRCADVADVADVANTLVILLLMRKTRGCALCYGCLVMTTWLAVVTSGAEEPLWLRRELQTHRSLFIRQQACFRLMG